MIRILVILALLLAPAARAQQLVATNDTSGTLTLNAATSGATITIPLGASQQIVQIAVSGLAASGATLTPEVVRPDGSVHAGALLENNASTAAPQAFDMTITTDGAYTFYRVAGYPGVALKVTAVGTGTITVSYAASAGSPLDMGARNALAALGGALLAGQNAAGTLGLNYELLGGCTFYTTPTTLTSTHVTPLNCDAGSNLLVDVITSVLPPNAAQETGGNLALIAGALTAITPSVSSSAASSVVGKGSAGSLYRVYATNLTTTAGFLVTLNATSAPTTGSAIAPLDCVPLPAQGSASISYSDGPPEAFSTGIVVGVSSNPSCYTFVTGVITAFIHAQVK